MQQKDLHVQVRTSTGKGAARRLRVEALVPGVVYGKGMTPLSVTVGAKELSAAVAGEGGKNNLLTLKGAAELDGTLVLVADMTRDPLRGVPTHVDFHKISLTDKVHVAVKVHVTGNAKGVVAGGMLDLAMHELRIECLPTQIPEHIDVDVTALGIGQAVHVGELQLPAGVRVLEDAKASVVCILGRAKEEAAAEGAA